MNAIDASGLRVALGGQTVLHHASLQAAAGELVGLIGPNGAGKSTLLRALLKLVPFQAGEILLRGQPLTAFSARTLARTLAYLPQDHTVHWPLTASRVVELGRTPHLKQWHGPGTEDFRVIANVMRETDTASFAARPITTLSGGELTRVMLARILATEAPIVLADEPIASLDPYHQLHVMELLKETANSGACIVVVLHDLSMASRFCDRLFLLHHGKSVAYGTPAEVLSEQRLSDIYRVESLQGEKDGIHFVLPWKRHA